MFIPGSIPTNTNLPLPTMNHHHHLHQQQQFLFDNLSKYEEGFFFFFHFDQITSIYIFLDTVLFPKLIKKKNSEEIS